MSHVKSAIVGIGLVLTCGATHAQQLAWSLVTIPVVVKGPGIAGSMWQSDLVISNLSEGRNTIGVMFFEEGHANVWDGITWDVIITVTGNQTVSFDDVIGTWFPQLGNTKGFLVIVSDPMETGNGAAFAASSRTYNAANPDATYGQGVSPAVFGLASANKIALSGARQDNRFRSNIGVANLEIEDTLVVITVFDGLGNVVSEQIRPLEALSMRQWSLPSLGAPHLSAHGKVEVRFHESVAPQDPETDPGFIYAYMSKVDMVTNDAEYFPGAVVEDPWEKAVRRPLATRTDEDRVAELRRVTGDTIPSDRRTACLK